MRPRQSPLPVLLCYMDSFKLLTFGCKVNQYETQEIREQLLSLGLNESSPNRKADIYIINSCTVTSRADADSLAAVNRAIRENPCAKIFFTGCLAELDAGLIKSRFDRKVQILKNNIKPRIAEYIFEGRSFPEGIGKKNKGISFFEGHTRAFLKVQYGCNNFCSYCKVPLVRGRSRSRPLKDVEQEARRLVASGVKEIVLCGICLGSYGGDLKPSGNICDIVKCLEDIEGLLRIRLSSIEPLLVSRSLINLMEASSKLCRHLHIPLQSGDDRVLRMMNRRYSSKDYLGLIERIKSKVSGVSITTDILVGFPGETEKAFQNTLRLIKQILPLRGHVFSYSKRPGTAAARLSGALNPPAIKERARLARDTVEQCSLKYKRTFLGKVVRVLFEDRSKTGLRRWSGYTDNYMRLSLSSRSGLKNKLISLKAIGLDKDGLVGQDLP